MRVLFTTSHCFLPQRVGGSERSIDTLVRGLIDAGHDAAVFARLQPNDSLGIAHRIACRLGLRGRPPWDRRQGYRVYRSWTPEISLPALLDRFAPDVAVVEGSAAIGRAQALRNAGVTVAASLRDAEWHSLSGTPHPDDGIAYFANSDFTANAYRERFDIAPARFYPPVDGRAYRSAPGGGRVTFVNPVPEKGVHIALALAERNPDIPFIFVRGWPRPRAERHALARRLSRLRNVELVGPIRDMRPIYKRTRLLLVPSQWQEAWGRVVAEAQFSAIPALASRCGGLPEAVGAGGVLVDRFDSLAAWQQALRGLWDDKRALARLSRAAIEEPERPTRDYSQIVARFADFISKPELLDTRHDRADTPLRKQSI